MHSFCPFVTVNDVFRNTGYMYLFQSYGSFFRKHHAGLHSSYTFAFRQQHKGFNFSTFSQIVAIFRCFNDRHFTQNEKERKIRLRQREIRRLNHSNKAFRSPEDRDLCAEQPKNRHRKHHRVIDSLVTFRALWAKYLVLRLRTKDLKPQCCGALSNVQDSNNTEKAKLDEAVLYPSLL